MRKRIIWVLVLAGVALVVAFVTKGIGFTARRTPMAVETSVMRGLRRWAVPSAVRTRANPVAPTAEAVRDGLEHWADHCASCHANDGSGNTSLGRSLHPPAPDMRTTPTQALTDGELFYVIERGVPWTGMPAWGNGTDEGERASWALVLFIRHLPQLTDAEILEMEKLNPKSSAESDQERRINDFLRGRGRE